MRKLEGVGEYETACVPNQEKLSTSTPADMSTVILVDMMCWSLGIWYLKNILIFLARVQLVWYVLSHLSVPDIDLLLLMVHPYLSSGDISARRNLTFSS